MILSRLFGTGPVWFKPWPEALQTLIDGVPESARQNVCDIKAYCIIDFLDTAHVWRLNIPQQAYDSLKRSFSAKELPTLDPSDSFWRQPPRWWDPDPKTDAEYVVWLGLPPEVITMYDKKNEVLYGYSQNDFVVHIK